jgi:hypothetical protein
MTRIDEVKLILNTIQDKLTRLEEYVQNFDPANTSISRLKARQQILEGIRREFEETQYEFETLDSKCQEMKIAHRESRIAFENKYRDVMADMMDIINSASNPETKTVPASVSDIPLNFPVINVGTFSGNYKNWTNFENSFKSVIHENKGLNNKQRLQYLKSCLREEALRAIESLPIEDENYEKAWEILENRFKNTRLIVQDHVTSILNAPTMNKQSRTALRELLTSNIAALKTLKIQVESWDALIIPIITEKLDYNTKKDWQTSLDTKVPTYGQFINFLEKRCTVLEWLNSISNKSSNQAQSSNTSFQKSTQPSKSTVALAATNQNSNLCIYCKKANHSIYQCTEFLNLSIQSRNEKARLMKLCLNCLRNNHATSACRNTTKCRYCNNRKHKSINSN